MTNIPRTYEKIIQNHFLQNRQMVFLSGPRQVGKTTICEDIATRYFNWDYLADRTLLLRGEDAVAEESGLQQKRSQLPTLVFDEIHHYEKWKLFLKGFFDIFGKRAHILVTGSSRLDVFKKSGDSLMGRYFPYRMHPLSVGELLHPVPPEQEIAPPSEPNADDFKNLVEHGGFPEPFQNRSAAFSRRWRRLRTEQLIRDDLRKGTNIHELEQLEVLASLLANRSGGQLVYASLAREIQVSEITVRTWIDVLQSFFFGFTVRPWFANVENSLRKSPKWYLRDWSGISDEGARNETMLACHLLKAVDMWSDLGLGDYGLYYLRDKQQREVDFLVSRNDMPWILVESKTSDTHLSPSLAYMQAQTSAPIAVQTVAALPFDVVNCFEPGAPEVVPLSSFLSQLP